MGDAEGVVDGVVDTLGGGRKGMLPGKSVWGELGGIRLLTFRWYRTTDMFSPSVTPHEFL